MSRRLYIGNLDVSNMMKLDEHYVKVPFPQPSETVFNYLIVGGGGGGGSSETTALGITPGGAGGGAGGVVTGSLQVATYTSHTVTVGEGGDGGSSIFGSNGQDSSVFDIVGLGGGGGGQGIGGSVPNCNSSYGRSGGSGGGAGGHPYTPGPCDTGSGLQPTSSYGGFGNDGYAYPLPANLSGGGGGAGGPAVSVVGGSGFVWSENGETYAVGGTADSAPANNTTSGSGGYGGVYGGTQTGRPGLDGLAVIWYDGVPRAIGGDIKEIGGKTYHYFTSSSQFYTWQ